MAEDSNSRRSQASHASVPALPSRRVDRRQTQCLLVALHSKHHCRVRLFSRRVATLESTIADCASTTRQRNAR